MSRSNFIVVGLLDLIHMPKSFNCLIPQTIVKSISTLISLDVISHKLCSVLGLACTICTMLDRRLRNWRNSLNHARWSQVCPIGASCTNLVGRRVLIHHDDFHHTEESRPSGTYIVATVVPANQKSILFIPPPGESTMMGDRILLSTGSSSTSTTSGLRFCGVPSSGAASGGGVTAGGVSACLGAMPISPSWPGFDKVAAARSASLAAAYSSSAFANPSCSCFCFSMNFCFWVWYSSSNFFWNLCQLADNWAISTFNLAEVFPDASNLWLACLITWGPLPRHLAKYDSTSGLASCPRLFKCARKPEITPSACLDGTFATVFCSISGRLTPKDCIAEEEDCQGVWSCWPPYSLSLDFPFPFPLLPLLRCLDWLRLLGVAGSCHCPPPHCAELRVDQDQAVPHWSQYSAR